MSAKLETFFELKKVIDHDCGNYVMGEIDFVNYAKIREYISEHSEFGWQQLTWVVTRILNEAQDQLVIERQRQHTEDCGDSGV